MDFYIQSNPFIKLSQTNTNLKLLEAKKRGVLFWTLKLRIQQQELKGLMLVLGV